MGRVEIRSSICSYVVRHNVCTAALRIQYKARTVPPAHAANFLERVHNAVTDADTYYKCMPPCAGTRQVQH